ncbi:hypothetical protein LJC44_06185 [Parabacteroides sp. OttesenSCG-928-G06]|nr:hypothetical protein [Parabacteroides sp. OttesenSCG-928-G06]
MYATNSLQGFHLSGLGSYAKGDGNGMMISGLLNHTKAYSGFQLAGLMNVAEDVNGFQFAGLVNKARNVKGVQFAGLINIADNSDYPIGLINLIRNGEKSVGVTYDEIGSTIVGFRSGGRIMYGILGMGYNHKAKEEKYVMEGGFGAHIPLSSRFRINAELRSQFLTDFSEDNQINHNTFAIMPAFRITPHFEIFGGPSINFMYTENINNKNMFPGGHIWKKFTEAELKQLYIGFSAGVQYIF